MTWQDQFDFSKLSKLCQPGFNIWLVFQLCLFAFASVLLEQTKLWEIYKPIEAGGHLSAIASWIPATN